MQLEPLMKKKLFQEIVEKIQYSIQQGELKPGDQLPTERELSQQLSVSRSSVREALLALQTMGYIEIRQSQGAFVKDVKLEDIIEPIISVINIDKKMIIDLLNSRNLLESEISREAAINATDEDIKSIEDAIKEEELEVEEGNIGLTGDDLFHAAIVSSTNNQVYKLIMFLIRDLLSKSREATLKIEGQPYKTIEDHKQILEAIKERNPDKAQEMMRSHLYKAQNNIIKYAVDNND